MKEGDRSGKEGILPRYTSTGMSRKMKAKRGLKIKPPSS